MECHATEGCVPFEKSGVKEECEAEADKGNLFYKFMKLCHE